MFFASQYAGWRVIAFFLAKESGAQIGARTPSFVLLPELLHVLRCLQPFSVASY